MNLINKSLASIPAAGLSNFETVEALDSAIETYLGDCSPHKATHAVLKDKADGTTYWAVVEHLTGQNQ